MEKAGKYIENEELREQIKACGIGTSATRSGIIKKFKDIGYIKILLMVQNREITEEIFEAKLNSYITRTIARVKQYNIS